MKVPKTLRREIARESIANALACRRKYGIIRVAAEYARYGRSEWRAWRRGTLSDLKELV